MDKKKRDLSELENALYERIMELVDKNIDLKGLAELIDRYLKIKSLVDYELTHKIAHY